MALFDVDVVEPTCSFDWGFTQAFRMMLALPLCFAAVQVMGYFLRLKKWDEAYAGTLSFFVDAQASLLYYCISSFICRRFQPADNFVVVVDPTTSCTTTSMTVMVDGMIDASPRIRAQVEAMRARTRLAVRVQRAWRRRQGWSGVISA